MWQALFQEQELGRGEVGFLAWFRSRRDTPEGGRGWEVIGSEAPFIGSERTENVPEWVLRTYSRCHVHHDGVVYRFQGNHYQYKVVESGQGGGYHTFYRRLRI